MTAARLTAAEARALGLAARNSGTRTKAGPKVDAEPKAPYHTTCHECGAELTTQAAEDRHFATTKHPHYMLILR